VPRSLGVGWWPRGVLQKYLRVIRWTQTPSTGSEGSMPPSGGIPLQIVPASLGNVLGYVSNVPRVIPHSACSGATVEPFRGASLRTPDQ
jgi:hypothetical protein